MTATIRIYGASDDLVEVEGPIHGADEYTSDGTWTGVLEGPDGHTAYVYADYRPNGTWTVSLGQFEEGYALPAWPITLRVDMDECDYSTVASIEVPEGTTLKEVSA